MSPSCEAQTCGFRICCKYCDSKEDCGEVCGAIDKDGFEVTECLAFTDDEEE